MDFRSKNTNVSLVSLKFIIFVVFVDWLAGRLFEWQKLHRAVYETQHDANAFGWKLWQLSL